MTVRNPITTTFAPNTLDRIEARLDELNATRGPEDARLSRARYIEGAVLERLDRETGDLGLRDG